MRRVFIAMLAAVSVALLVSTPIIAEGGGSDRAPYIIFSDEPTLKGAFGVRHNFPGMFTTNLSPGEVRMLSRFGFKTERVKMYHISKPPGACDDWPKCKNGGGDDGGGGDARLYFPDDQTPWGIETIYDDTGIASTSGGSGINVAVLDTGVYKDHLDLTSRVAQCIDFTAGGPFRSRVRKGSCSDDIGHGTHVAGTIAADGGSDMEGIYGVAPEANLFAYKVCGNNGCWTDDIATAIDYAGRNGADIVSMSLGGDSESSLIAGAIARNSSILFIAAAGNDGPNIGSIDYPAANPAVVAVGAINSLLAVANFSSRGINDGDCVIEEREVELAAPGVSVESTMNDGSYAFGSGTSMATPHVAGLAAREWQVDAASTRLYLQSLADGCADDPATGFGLPQLP